MTITRHFKETVQARGLREPEFRVGLLRESIENMLAGDMDTGKMLLRDYINATIGFEILGAAIDKSPKSLMCMFSAAATPPQKTCSASSIRYSKKKASSLRSRLHGDDGVCPKKIIRLLKCRSKILINFSIKIIWAPLSVFLLLLF